MKASEIIKSITWAADTDPAVRQQVEDAILRLGASNRPMFNLLAVNGRLEDFVKRQTPPTANRAAEVLGISKSFMHDIRSGNRPVPDHVLKKLGIQRAPDLYSDI